VNAGMSGLRELGGAFGEKATNRQLGLVNAAPFSFSIKKCVESVTQEGAAISDAITNIENASETTGTTPSLPQDLVHGLTLGQVIH